MTSLFRVVAFVVMTASQEIGLAFSLDERLSFEVRPRIVDVRPGQSIVVDCEPGGSPSSVIHMAPQWTINYAGYIKIINNNEAFILRHKIQE